MGRTAGGLDVMAAESLKKEQKKMAEHRKEKKEENKNRHSILSNTLFWVKYDWRNVPVVLWIRAFLIVLGPLQNMLGIYLPKAALGLVERRVELGVLTAVLGGYGLLYALVMAFRSYLNNHVGFLENLERQRVLFQLFLKSLRLDYSYVESKEGEEAYYKALNVQRASSAPSQQMLLTVQETTVNILNFVLYSTVLGRLSVWVVVILLLFSGMNYLIKKRENRLWNSIRADWAENQKHYNYVRSAMGNVSAAKDIRIFDMGGWLRGRMEEVLSDAKRLTRRERIWSMENMALGRILAAAQNVGAYAYLIYRASTGEMAASDFMLYFSAISGFAGFVTGITGSAGSLRRYADDTDCVRGYLELPEEDMVSGSRHIDTLEQPVSIEFQDVGFSYGSEGEDGRRQIFSHLNLKIEAGEKLALVGVNGAGKTTLVKLLCGFCEPEEGRILFNGIDAREFPKGERYKLFSVVFQDIFLPPVKAEESIVLEKAEDVDRGRLRDALKKAGMEEVFREKGFFEDGTEQKAYMGNVYSQKGMELSGGQRQRLLLARALYKDGAVLVLDEPTAALDPIAESEVYSAYQKYCSGKTSIFISHRLASTSFSDKIVLLDQGKVVETGTHKELLERGGAYAEMFRIQSSYYQ